MKNFISKSFNCKIKRTLLDVPKFVNNKTTNGIFAPWALYKKDFLGCWRS